MKEAIRVGIQAPGFDLPGVDGKNHTLGGILEGRRAAVILFWCNHCPYVSSYEERIKKMAQRYAPKGVAFVLINSDSEAAHPEDSLENMKKRAAAAGYPFPYLRDKDGAVAGAYEAGTIPEAFVVDAAGAVRYAGKIDDCWQSERRVKRQPLRDAIEDVLHDRDVAVKTAPPVGCAIKREA
ncbi:MAG: thioredoxin family protein [Nitrospinae bacterium]|nr:thioredoxin family protein [Nitrospinota bacterium]